jgi:hypothetical protein
MSSQIFKISVPNHILFECLELFSIKTDKCYVVNNNAFKKGIYNKSISEFIENCKPYYFLSKKKYLERELTYTTFTTILRQICKHNKIVYTSQIKYANSDYDIYYYIYF